jgi:hypothetical protein
VAHRQRTRHAALHTVLQQDRRKTAKGSQQWVAFGSLPAHTQTKISFTLSCRDAACALAIANLRVPEKQAHRQRAQLSFSHGPARHRKGTGGMQATGRSEPGVPSGASRHAASARTTLPRSRSSGQTQNTGGMRAVARAAYQSCASRHSTAAYARHCTTTA